MCVCTCDVCCMYMCESVCGVCVCLFVCTLVFFVSACVCMCRSKSTYRNVEARPLAWTSYL
jgi:hypothetical protein